jgi:hypothetical protein
LGGDRRVCHDALVPKRSRRRGQLATLASVLLVVAVVVATSGPPASAGRGQERDSDTTVATQVPTRDIIPAPNEGVAPRDAGDRGGAAQLALVAAIVGGLAVIAVLAVRDARGARGARAASRRVRSSGAPDGEGPAATTR